MNELQTFLQKTNYQEEQEKYDRFLKERREVNAIMRKVDKEQEARELFKEKLKQLGVNIIDNKKEKNGKRD